MIFMTLVLEIMTSGISRNLLSGYGIQTIIGIIIQFIITTLSVFIMTVFACKLCKVKNIRLVKSPLKIGLNQKSRFFVLLYYSHFFFIRHLVLILVGLSQVINSLYLWIVLLVFQFAICVAYIFRIFNSV
jgi:hypothetical protein